MTLQPYTVIRLLTDRYSDRCVLSGSVGIILDVCGQEAYDVEFSDQQGHTIAWFAVQQSEVEAFVPSRPAMPAAC